MNKDPGKQYGLILPKKGSSHDVIQRPSIFDEGSESGDSDKGDRDWKKKAFQMEGSAIKKQNTNQIKKALNQDPSIYSYDEIYDDIKDKSNSTTNVKKDEKKTSRYIQSLKRNAERRKLENERRLEREVQKERQLEGEQFKDKETFVTSSYKKKLEEFKIMDDEEKRIDRLEEIGDVTKQRDISGFYRHLYRTTVDPVKTEEKKSSETQSLNDESTTKFPAEVPSKIDEIIDGDKKRKRQYRKRRHSGSSKEEGEKTTSSSSSSSTSSSSENESDEERNPKLKKQAKRQHNSVTSENSKAVAQHSKENVELKANDDTPNSKPNISVNVVKEDKAAVKSILNDSSNVVEHTENIWLKRTVGSIFDDAQKRYFERKANRLVSY